MQVTGRFPQTEWNPTDASRVQDGASEARHDFGLHVPIIVSVPPLVYGGDTQANGGHPATPALAGLDERT